MKDLARGNKMKKYWKALSNLAIALLVLLFAIYVAPKILIFFSPFVVGWVIALIAGPFVRFFEEKIKLKRKAGSAFVIVVIIGCVVFAIYLLGSVLVDQMVGLVSELPEMWEGVKADLDDIAKNFNSLYKRFPLDLRESFENLTTEIGSYIGDHLGKISTPTIAAAGNFAKRLPTIIIGTIMALLSSYFFVAERAQINQWFLKTMPKTIQLRYDMLRRGLLKAVGGYLIAQCKIEVWMYLLLLIGLTVLAVDYAFLIALGIAFLDFLPFLGTGTVMVPWAILKMMSGDYSMAIGLIVIWGGGQIARQVIQPKIVGDSIGVPPIPTLFLLYIGYKMGGVLGMIIAVPIGLILYTMYQEGAFETTEKSIYILVAGLNSFRKIEAEDMCQVEQSKKDSLMEKKR